MDKDESPEDFLLGIKPMWPLNILSSPEITERETGSQKQPTQLDHKQIILISLLESSVGRRSGKGRVYQLSNFTKAFCQHEMSH